MGKQYANAHSWRKCHWPAVCLSGNLSSPEESSTLREVANYQKFLGAIDELFLLIKKGWSSIDSICFRYCT